MSHRSKMEEKRRLRKMYHKTQHGYARGAWYYEDKGRIVRYYNRPIFGYWCRLSNRKFRHRREEVRGRSDFKKTGVDPWWWTW